MRRFIVALSVLLLAGCATSGGSGAPPDQRLCSPRVAWGDSITADQPAWGVTGWPDQPPINGSIVNNGRNGDTVAHLVGSAILTVDRCATKPDRLYFLVGAVDLALGESAEFIEASFAYLLANIQVPITIIAITPYVEAGPQAVFNPTRVAVNAWLHANAGSSILDCNSALADGSGWLRPEYSIDGIVHLNNAGQLALAACVDAAG